ncbi:MAG: HAD family hydrolase [Gemmatimonadaceae bacterium]|nr:HAD family hydrolase [Gemmatimonadaceae bacterium]
MTGPRVSGATGRTDVSGPHGVLISGENRASVRELRPAVFLDRDGTLIVDKHYLREPDEVQLMPDAANLVRKLNYMLYPAIVVTNQSGIAQGLLTEADYDAVRRRVDDLISERGAFIDQHYHCPHHPDFTGPCGCRKPGTVLYERAVVEHAINPAMSLWIGDRWRDIAPALHFSGRGILVPTAETPPEEIEQARAQCEVAENLLDVIHHLPGR